MTGLFNDLTFVYVVGGKPTYYKCLEKSLRSLKDRITPNPITYISEINATRPFDFWKSKYNACQEIKTTYGVYIDTDVVFVNNTIEENINKINQIGVSKSVWVTTMGEYYEKCSLIRDKDMIIYEGDFDLSKEDPFYAAGCFFFKKTPISTDIFSEIYKMHEKYDIDNIPSMTDEPIMASVFKKNKNMITNLNHAINHTCYFPNTKIAPIEYRDGIFYGRGSFDDEFEKVLLFHADTYRRDVLAGTSGKIKEEIKEIFYL